MWIITKLTGSTPVRRTSAVNTGENSFKPHMLWNHSSSSFLSLAHVHLVTHGQLRKSQRTYVKRAVRKPHFKLNRTFHFIPGRPYRCRQKSRTVCRRNVVMCNWCRCYFWNLQRYGNRKTANSSISTISLRFDDAPAKNAFECLQMIYIARN